MITFFTLYSSAILRILNLIVWSIWFSKREIKGFNKVTILYFLGFNLIHVIWNSAMLIGHNHPKIYITFWILIVIFEILMVLTILFSINNLQKKFHDYYIIIIGILSIPVILAGIISALKWDYKPINVMDFNVQLLLTLGSIWILKNLLAREDFLENIETFLIFSGMIMLFSLHILASNSQYFGFLKNWKIANSATIISQIFWLGGVFTSWKIRSKYLS